MKHFILFFFFSGSIFGDTIWHKSVVEGFAVAQKRSIPIIIDLYADWCTYCKVLEKEIFPEPSVMASMEKFVKIRINGEEYPNLMDRYNVKGFPTILLLDKNGYYMTKLTGLPTKSMIIEKLKIVYNNRNLEESLIARWQKSPEDTDANFKLGNYYYQIANLDKALVYLHKAILSKDVTSPEKKQESYYNLCLLYMDMERFEDAIKEWTNYIKKYSSIEQSTGTNANNLSSNLINNSNIYSAYYFRGIAHLNLGKQNAAKDDLTKASSLTEDTQKKEEITKIIKKLPGKSSK